MFKFTRHLALSLLGIFLIIFPFQTSLSGVIKKYEPALGADDLFLIGFSELTFHSLSVDGNVSRFESDNPWLKDGFSGNYRTSLFANGNLSRKLFINGAAIVDSRVEDEYRQVDPSVFRLKMSVKSSEPLWDDWRFTGEGMYDPQRQWEIGNLDTRLLTQTQEPARLELLARLDSDKYGYIEGGSLRPSFKNSTFSLHRRSLFGVFADINHGSLGFEAVGGKLEGKSFRKGTSVGVRANGTTGPYDLENPPITRGSEEIKIEVRDRFDQTTVISSRTLISDVDYTIDYLRGRVILNMPVASETIASDPVFIVITYDYQRDENDNLVGGRVSFQPGDEFEGGVSLLHRFRDDNATGIGIDEPDDLGAVDATFDFDKIGSGYVEYAGSESEDVGGGNQAFRAGIASQITDQLSVTADFQKIKDQFMSFTNSDLNPTKNQQRLNLGGIFNLNEKQTFNLSYGNILGLEAGGEYNPYPGRRDEKKYIAGYRNNFNKSLRLGLMVEQRDVQNKDDITTEDNHQRRIAVDLDGTRDSFGFLKQFSYGLHFERIGFSNDLNLGTMDNNTNQAALSLSTKSEKGYYVELIQKIRHQDYTNFGLINEREDGTFVTVRLQPRKDLSTLLTAEYKRFARPGENLSFLSLWQDSPYKVSKSGTFAVEYLPFEILKTVGKIGRYDQQQWDLGIETRSTDDFAMGQLVWFYNHHLSVTAETEFRNIKADENSYPRNRTWDIGIKLNWNKDRFNQLNGGVIRRDQTKENSLGHEFKSESYIILAGGSVSLMRNFFVRGSVKTILLESLEDEKTFFQIEAGYEGRSWYRVSVGYEQIENDTKNNPNGDNYRGRGIFVRLTGKL